MFLEHIKYIKKNVKSFYIVFFSILIIFLSIKFINFNYYIELQSRKNLPEYKIIEPIKLEKATINLGIQTADTKSKWYRSFQNNQSIKHSSLDQINEVNINKLEIAWESETDDPGSIQSNPVFIDNKLFLTTANKLISLNPKNGEKIWEKKFDFPNPGKRGFASFFDEKLKKNILAITNGTEIYTMLAENGKPYKAFGNEGIISIENTAHNTKTPMPSSPIIVDNKIIVSKVNYDVEDYSKIICFDLKGNKLWEFNLNKSDEKSKYAGANAWVGMSADDARKILFVTTGNPYPDAVGINRPGDNLYSNCILAIDVNTGKLLWYFQEVKHDLWDLDIASAPIVSSVKIDGVRYDVVIAATKLGNTIVLDRLTGKNIFPWRLRKTKPSKIKNEKTSRYQPYIEIPEPFIKQELTFNDLNLNENIDKKLLVDIKEGVYDFFPNGDINKANIFYGKSGGASYGTSSYDELNSIIYISANQTGYFNRILNTKKYNVIEGQLRDLDNNLLNDELTSFLIALDLSKGKIIWKKPIPDNNTQFSKMSHCGILSTKGKLIFCSGTSDYVLRAYSSLNGDVLWEYQLNGFSSVTPITYMYDNEQYILTTSSLSNGGYIDIKKNNSDQIIAFKLKN